VKLKHIYKNLDELYSTAHDVHVQKGEKYVVFSDLHLGDGSSKDDFRRNSDLFTTALQKYYLPQQFKLILNGDIEELQRFSLARIKHRWKAIYDVFHLFDRQGRLYKLIGNHDLDFVLPDPPQSDFKLYEALNLHLPYGNIFLFHGHQASYGYHRINRWVGYALKYLANPLRIKNYSVAHNSRKQYKLEKRVYHYSSYRKRVSIIGHTHRPLFESLSKAERLKFRIEQLCRQVAREHDKEKFKQVKKNIKAHKKELKKIYTKNNHTLQGDYLYNSIFHIPCLFNSGCAIGKRGMTCLEITHEEIALIHWFSTDTSQKYLDRRGYDPMLLSGTNAYRMVLNREYLDYIFTRIKLLA
jgi:UDP-2,3-diacylglucosamine pyrophosphatase LpxH